MTPEHETVLILDFGGQYTQLIARRVREIGVYCEIVPYNTPIDSIWQKKPRGIILSGGPASVYEPGAPHCDRTLFEAGVPVLGIEPARNIAEVAQAKGVNTLAEFFDKQLAEKLRADGIRADLLAAFRREIGRAHV